MGNKSLGEADLPGYSSRRKHKMPKSVVRL